MPLSRDQAFCEDTLDSLPHFCYFPALLQCKGAVHEIFGNYSDDGWYFCRKRLSASLRTGAAGVLLSAGLRMCSGLRA